MSIKLSQIKSLALASYDQDHEPEARYELRDFISENAEECAHAFGCHVGKLRDAIRSFEDQPRGALRKGDGVFDALGFARATLATIQGIQKSGRSTKAEAKAYAAQSSADAMACALRLEFVDGAPRIEVEISTLRACLLSSGILTIASESLEVTFAMDRIHDVCSMVRTNKRCANACAYVDAKGLHLEWRACSSGRWTRGGVNVCPMREIHAIQARRDGEPEIRANLATSREVAA